jgi:hypothetical protein
MSAPKNNVIFVFLDGVGLGPDDTEVNPFARMKLEGFEIATGGSAFTETAPRIANPGHVFHPIDARLGVDGLPQSGTGQATLFTGVNCATLAGKHFGPYPHSTSANAIENSNIFSRLKSIHRFPIDELAFANTYPERFFDLVERTKRWTVTTKCCLAAGIHIRTTEALASGYGVAADLTGRGLRTIDDSVIPVSEVDAATNLIRLSDNMRFTLFEYFHTDKAGHSQSFSRASKRIRSLDVFFSTLFTEIDVNRTVVIMTSDHGNIEDLSTKSHTLNPVPFLAFGKNALHFEPISDLSEVAERIVSWYDID